MSFVNWIPETVRPSSLIVPAVILMLYSVLLWPGASYAASAWLRPEYSHGPLSVIIFGALVLRQLGIDPEDVFRTRPDWVSTAFLVMSLILAGLSTLFSLGALSAFTGFLVICAVFYCLLEPRKFVRFIPALLVLLVALPLPESLFWQVQNGLQRITAIWAVGLTQIAGTNAQLVHNVIDVDGIYLSVAQACSGFQYILPILSFAAVVAALVQGPIWVRVAIVILAAPVAIVMNAVRVAILTVIVEIRGDASHITGFAHFLEGWLIFLTSIVLLFVLVKVLNRLAGNRDPLADQFDLDFAPVRAGARRLSEIQTAGLARWAVLPLVVAVGISLAGPLLAPLSPRVGDQTAVRYGEWFVVRDTSRHLPIETSAQSSGFSVILVREAPYGVISYARMARKDEFFAPSLPRAFLSDLPDWEVERLRYRVIPAGPETAQPLRVAELTVVRGFARQLVFYWFDGACGPTASLAGSRVGEFCPDRSDGSRAAGWVRVSTRMSSDPGAEEVAAERLAEVALLIADNAR